MLYTVIHAVSSCHLVECLGVLISLPLYQSCQCPFTSFKLTLLSSSATFSSSFTHQLSVLYFPLLSLHPSLPLLYTLHTLSLFQSPNWLAPPYRPFTSSPPLSSLIRRFTLSSPPSSVRRSPTSSQSVSAAVTVWTLTTQSVSSACGVRAGRASRSSCPSYTAANAPAAKVESDGCGRVRAEHFSPCRNVCM